ncbi:hypothetical protein [Paenibacillus soyae]|uniref:Uncharacterized protein n=1 Tax=Paenibacillus soyae TaxID=2969249 RepID=A0A9X2S9Y6_9BACL|nr:hypothetical protein [Paenibacillus soyae]MCR2805969.1 hypothetical protein [Paenibacillus soyae]
MAGGNEEALESLSAMGDLFEGFFDWLADRYDPVSGGFYYAGSSAYLAKEPDIESTAQALTILDQTGLLTGMPVTVRRRLIAFLQRKQDPAGGYFWDEDPAMRQDEVMAARAIGYSRNALYKLGAEPLYPLPGGLTTAPSYMSSPSAYREWLKSIPLTNSWRGCDRLCGSQAYIKALPVEKQGDYVKEALRFFEETQDSATGLWGEGSLYVRVSGTFKLHTFYGAFRERMPRTDDIRRTVLHCLRTEEAIDMCYIRNPVDLMYYTKAAMDAEELAGFLKITLGNMGRLLRPDGGFSRELAHSPAAPNVAQVKDGEYYPDMPEPVRLGLGLLEGDMNAGTQAVRIREWCHKLAGLPAPKWKVDDVRFFERFHAGV